MVEIARKSGHLPMGTFDRDLAKLNGVRRIGSSEGARAYRAFHEAVHAANRFGPNTRLNTLAHVLVESTQHLRTCGLDPRVHPLSQEDGWIASELEST
jgi:hypothetical protein